MQADTIVVMIDFGEYDFIEMFDNTKNTKKIKDDDVINFFIPFLHYKYNDTNSKIDESIIMDKFDAFFKNVNFIDGIEMMVKKEEELLSEEIQKLIKRKKMKN